MMSTRDQNVCKHCGRPKLDHYARNPDGSLKYDNPTAVIKSYVLNECNEFKEWKASRHYDDVLRRIPDHGPEKTALTDLIIKGSFVSDAFIVAPSYVFNLHLKSFIYSYIEERRNRIFSFKRIDVPAVREVKFSEGGNSFAKLDNAYVLLFDLDVEGYDNKADSDHIKELVEYRKRRVLPVWFITSNSRIPNKNVPVEVKNMIRTMKQTLLDPGAGSSASFPTDTTTATTTASSEKSKMAEKAKKYGNRGNN